MAGSIVKVIRRFEDSSVPVGGRINTSSGAAASQADVSSISYKIFDLTDNSETGNGNLSVAAVISNTLNTVGWNEDDLGTNFRYNFAPALFPNGDRDYRGEVKITMTDGFVDWIVFRVPAMPLLTS